MKNKFLDLFFKHKTIEEDYYVEGEDATPYFIDSKSKGDSKRPECIYSNTSKVVDYINLKDDRSNKVTFQGIGRTKYGSGQPPTSLYADPEKAFSDYPIVYACVTAIADAISTLGVKVYKTKRGEQVEDNNHEYYDLHRAPNPYQSSQEFLESIVLQCELFGNCFIAKEKGGKLTGNKIELYPLLSQYMALIPDTNLKVKEYRYVISGQYISYKPEEIIHIKYTNPSDSYFGAPPLTSAKANLELEKNRLALASAFFRNNAVPMGVLEVDGTYASSHMEKLRGNFERIHKGSDNYGRVAVLQGGVKFKALMSPLKDMDFKSLKELSNADIMAIYRIPPSVLGNLADTSGEEGKAALTAWWRNCLVPKIRRIEHALNRGLRNDIFQGGKSKFEYDLRNVQALADDKDVIAKYLVSLVSGSIMKINEARGVLGLEQLDDPLADQILISNSAFGNSLMPVSEIGNQGAGSNTPKPANTPEGNPAANANAKPKVPPKKDLDPLEFLNKKLQDMIYDLEDM